MDKYGRPKKSCGIKIWKHVNIYIIKKYTSQAEMAHAFNLYTREVEEGGSLHLWPAWNEFQESQRNSVSTHTHTCIYVHISNMYHLTALFQFLKLPIT